MHIIHVETGRYLYGGALQLLYLMKGLKQHGCLNTLACTPDSQIAKAAAGMATIHEVPMAGELDPLFAFRLWRTIRSVAPDIVHLHSRRGADLWGIMAARLAGLRVVLTRRVDNPEPSWLAQAKYRFCDRIITISEGIRRVLLSEGVPADRIITVPSAVDVDRYGKPCEGEWFRREFGLPVNVETIGVIAQFIARKGHRYLLQAIPTILETCPKAHVLFFGRGPMEEELKGLCRAKKLDDHIHFCGFRDDLDRILPCLNLVVHPALMEGLGVALLQAAAAGLPIVATRVGGIPEVVQNGINGYLIDAADPNALVEPVLNLLRDPERAKRMGRAGLDIVRSHFSIEAMVNGNLLVYQAIAGKA
jgi:glycosyltransferase involved in cell wall biosynthesis